MVFQVINPTIDIALLSLAVSVASVFIQYRFLDRKRMKELQKQMQQNQKKMMELIKREDDNAKREMKKLEDDMNAALGEISKNSIKTMALAVIYLPIFWFLPSYDGASLPIGEFNFWVVHLPNYFAYYVAASVVFSIVFNALWEKVLEKKVMGS